MSHSITWLHPIAAKKVHIDGTTAYAVSGLFSDDAVDTLFDISL